MVNRWGIERTAAALLILFYAVGLVAHLYGPTRTMMTVLTPSALLAGGAVVLALAVREESSRRASLIVWCLVVIVGTFGVEAFGVQTGAVFGSYVYGTVLGMKAAGVPLVIGFNWALVVLGACLAAGRLLAPFERASSQPPEPGPPTGHTERTSSLEAPYGLPPQGAAGRVGRRSARRSLGATLHFALLTGLLAALFDVAMEPAAVALDYWSWRNGVIPFQNYAAWFVLAAAAALLFRGLRLRLASWLPVIYLAVQWCFFLGLDFALARKIS